MNNDFFNFMKKKIEQFQDKTGIILKNKIVRKFNVSSSIHEYTGTRVDADKALWEIIDSVSYSFNKSEISNHGIIFTPRNIAYEVIDNINLKKISNTSKIIDPSVGSGSLLVAFLERLIKSKKDINLKKFVSENIYGLDIEKKNVEATKCILSIFMELQGYDIHEFHIYTTDSLKITTDNFFKHFHKKFDIVIGNPPYVRAKRIPKIYREFLKNTWNSVLFGMIDLYIPFFSLAEWLMTDFGTVSFITPNTFLSSVNGKKLRIFLIDRFCHINIRNFYYDKLFGKKIMTYSTIISLTKNSNCQECVLTFDDKLLHVTKDGKPWRLLSSLDRSIIEKLENTYLPLKELEFKNGIATQRNSLYSFYPVFENENYFWIDDHQQVEKKITRPFVLPNRSDFKHLRIIFPYYYKEEENKFLPMKEAFFKETFPKAYNYLLKNKLDLEKRNSDSKLWYAYGRSQGLQQSGSRLYLPYMAKRVKTYLSTNSKELFAAGYAIFSNNIGYLNFLKIILESKLFTFYLQKVSKPYSSGYFSTSKTMIQHFSVPSEEYFNRHKNEINLIHDLKQLYNLNDKEIDLIKRDVEENI